MYVHGDSVTRIQVGAVDRPDIPIVLQPVSASRAGAFTVEVLPYYKPAKELSAEERRIGRQFILDNIPPGYDADLHHGNYGLGAGGLGAGGLGTSGLGTAVLVLVVLVRAAGG